MTVINLKYRRIPEPRPTPEQSKTLIKIAMELHEANPSLPLRECLRIIIDRHKKNMAKEAKR